MTRFTLIDHYWWCDQRLSTYDPWSVGPAELTSSTEPPSGMHCWLVRLRERLRFIYDLLFCLWGMVPRKIFENKKGSTAWKASKYWVISGPYFPTFGLNTEIYGVRIQCSEDVFSPNTGKYGPEITPHLDTFHALKCFWTKNSTEDRYVIYVWEICTLHICFTITTNMWFIWGTSRLDLSCT